MLAVTALGGCATAPPLSPDAAADIDRAVLVHLDQAWRDLDLHSDRPATGAVRWVLPNGWGITVARCMVAAGYPEYNYSMSGGFTDGAQALALYDCIKRYPIYSTVYARLDDAQLTALYEYYSSYLVPCLQSSGARVSAIPSEAEFRSGGEGYPGWWNPYLAIARPTSAAVTELLFDKCAAYPQ